MEDLQDNFNDFWLSNEEKIYLLKVARQSLESLFDNRADYGKGETVKSNYSLPVGVGAFVTLYNSCDLRGCIGRMEANEELDRLVQKMAVSAALNDHRFSSVKVDEINDLVIEVSVLTPKVKINSIDEFDLTKHGIYIQKGGLSGTFLPQVAAETGWDKEELLGRCARDKVGIGWFGWKEADLFVYEVIHFSEADFKP